MIDLHYLTEQIHSCRRCGENFTESAIGFGETARPKFMMIGINPKVKGHKFDNGRGITILINHLNTWGFKDYFFDNIVKCQMPNKKLPIG